MASVKDFDSVLAFAEGDGEHVHIAFRKRVDPYRTDPETEIVVRIPLEQADALQGMLYLVIKHERGES